MSDKMRTRLRAVSLLLILGSVVSLGAFGSAAEAPADGALPTLEDIREPAARQWRYTDDPVRLAQIQGTEWTGPDFDDSGWLTGTGAFGANNGRLEALTHDCVPTVCLRHYEPDGDAMPTYYFRLAFTAGAADMAKELNVDITYDDAALVYLNGQIIASCNAPEGGYPSPNAYGCGEVCVDPETGTVALDASLLREGTNILAVELHQANDSSTDVYFDMGYIYSHSPEEEQNAALRNDTVCLGVGPDGSGMLVCWQGPISRGACVLVTGADDPDFARAASFPARITYPGEEVGACTYRAEVTGLEPGEYLYRAVDAAPSKTFRFQVAEPGGSFSFLCHGDTQFLEGDDYDDLEIYQSLAEQTMAGGTPEFVLSLGDQVDDKNDPSAYRLFTQAPLLKSVPLAAVVGNHETESALFSRFFFLPNMDIITEDTSGDMSGDYWFFRDGVLFLCLNSNNEDVDAHIRFMRDAIDECVSAYGEPAWTVAALHHSFFSAGQHSGDAIIREGREPYSGAFTELGVDVVFSGHDHCYTRSVPMNGSQPAAEGERGVVYFTLGSSTGSKLYELSSGEADYAAFAVEGEYPEMARVDVTDQSVTVTVYEDRDGQTEVLDAYTITK